MKILFAAVALMAFGQAAQAAEPATAPLVLNDTQMDQVTAGGPPAMYFGGGGANQQATRYGRLSGGAADPYPTINAGSRRGGAYGGQA
jgi:hypothetical protein